MADTVAYFSKDLPTKLAGSPDLAKSINAVFQFDIDGAGSWSLDMTGGQSTVAEGTHAAPNCTIKTDKATWEKILDNPAMAIQMFAMGKLKASHIGLATQLQKILAP